jgi:hypothetical protein
MWTGVLGDSLFGEVARAIDAAVRLGGFDPFLATARSVAVGRWGAGISAMVSSSAMRFPTRTAVIDADGEIDYSTLDRRASNLGGYLRGAASGGAVGILCRNHAGFLLAQIAAEAGRGRRTRRHQRRSARQ